MCGDRIARLPLVAAAVADIDKRLRAEIRERKRHREQIARLAAGDNLALPPEVVEFLDRLRALGVDERIVQVERDGWIPLAAHSPERVPEWMARKRKQITDPQFIDFYLTLGQALDRTDDDPGWSSWPTSWPHTSRGWPTNRARNTSTMPTSSHRSSS